MQQKGTEIFYPSFVNINLDALQVTGLKLGEYSYCAIAEQYQRVTGWVECGVRNNFRFPYPLKIFIGTRLNFLERKTNRVFKKLRQKGFIEVAPDNQRFRVTEKFRVFDKDNAAKQTEFEARYVAHTEGLDLETLKAKKIPFSESIYINDLDQFKTDLARVCKTPDIDFTHYHETITNYYVVENPHIVFVDWLARCKKWIQQDQQKGQLVKLKKENVKASPLSKLSDEELTKDLDLFFDKMMNPETDDFKEYQETAQTFTVLAKEAIGRGDRILNEKGKEKAKQMFLIIKNNLKQFYDSRRKIQQAKMPIPDIEALARQMKGE